MSEVRTPDGDFATFIAGEYNATLPTLTDQDTAELQLDNRGRLQVGLTSATGTPATVQSGIDGSGNGNAMLLTQGAGLLYNGVTWDRQRGPVIFKGVNLAVTAGTPLTAWSPAAGKKFRLMGLYLALSVAGVVILKDAATEMFRVPGSGQLSLGNGLLSAAANNSLNIDVNATGTVTGVVFGTEE